jgi:CelD/BcsL family acetyltransferase involved in cellulose biosynthesis
MRADSITASTSRIAVHDDFAAVSPTAWNDLLARSATDEVFLTYEYQTAWWRIFSQGKSLLVVCCYDRELRAILPLYFDSGMIYAVGTGSDYIDIIGRVSEDELTAMLRAAMDAVSGPLGFQFYHVPAESPTTVMLAAAAKRVGMAFFEEQRWLCPFLDIEADHKTAVGSCSKKSLIRHERFFRRRGELRFEDITTPDDIESHLQELFDQHIDRWGATDSPSLFLADEQKAFYRELVRSVGANRWIRFTRVLWDGRPIALHFGFQYKAKFLWYKPSFDISLAKHSPGEVLLKHMLEVAVSDQFDRFDFGLGDEAFKKRFANRERHVVTLGLYFEQPLKSTH